MKTRLHTALILALGAGCGDAQVEQQKLGEESEPIINGQNVSNDTIGTPCLYNCKLPPNGGICTGTMLTPTWMLTAKHCVNTDNTSTGNTPRQPADVNAFLKGGPSVTAAQIMLHPGVDAALVRFTTRPTDASGRTVIGNRLYRGSSSSLLGQKLLIQGWGINDVTHCSGEIGVGEGTLRFGTVQPSVLASSGYHASPVLGQIAGMGDSGSATFPTVAGLPRPAGALSQGQCSEDPFPPLIVDTTYVGTDMFRDWAQGIIGNAPSVGTPAGFEQLNGTNSVFYRGSPGNDIQQLAFVGGFWTYLDITLNSHGIGRPTGTVSPYLRSDGANVMVFRDSGNHIFEVGLTPSGWFESDLTQISTNLFNRGSALDPSAYVRGDRVNAVVFTGTTDNHIYETSLAPGDNKWVTNDWTVISGGAPLARTNPVGYIRADGMSTVVYTGQDFHIHQLALTGPGRVTHADFANVLPTPLADNVFFSPPRPFSRTDGTTAIVYVDRAGHIQQLTFSAGANPSWSLADINTIPALSSLGRVRVAVPYVRHDSVNVILFQNTADKHIHEISFNPFTNVWAHTDLNQTASPSPAPDASTTLAPSGYVRSDRKSAVVYQATNGHIIELSFGTSWTWTDLTAKVLCSSASNDTCDAQGATCENVANHDLCRWGSVTTSTACASTVGLWTPADSGFAQNNPGSIPPGVPGACITQVANLACSASDTALCGSFGATCEKAFSVDGTRRDLCRWHHLRTQATCAAPGLWTPANSGFAQTWPTAVPKGWAGACITQVQNLR